MHSIVSMSTPSCCSSCCRSTSRAAVCPSGESQLQAFSSNWFFNMRKRNKHQHQEPLQLIGRCWHKEKGKDIKARSCNSCQRSTTIKWKLPLSKVWTVISGFRQIWITKNPKFSMYTACLCSVERCLNKSYRHSKKAEIEVWFFGKLY